MTDTLRIYAEDIRNVISVAPEGSDIYGLVEKIAFRVHKAEPSNESDRNWFIAQEALVEYAPLRFYFSNHTSFSLSLARTLQFRAHNSGLLENPLEDWINAQEYLADKVMEEVYHKNPRNVLLKIS